MRRDPKKPIQTPEVTPDERKNGMKKKLAICVLTLALMAAALLMAACKTESKTLNSTSDIFSYLLENGEFSEMSPNVGEDDLFELYGIDSTKLESYEFRFSQERLNAEEIAVFKLCDPEYGSILKGILTSHIASAARQAVGYNTKERCDMIKNTKVYEKGGYVFFVMNMGGEELSEKLLGLIPDN